MQIKNALISNEGMKKANPTTLDGSRLASTQCKLSITKILKNTRIEVKKTSE